MEKSLNDYSVVFCDSFEALEAAFLQGLSRSVIVKTTSPYLLWKSDINTENLDSKWSESKAREFHQTTEEFLKKIYDTVFQLEGFKEYALLISRLGINYQRFIYKTGCLNPEDFHEKRLFLKVKTNETDLNPPWDFILAANTKLKTIEYSEKNRIPLVFANNAQWLERFKLGGIEAFLYRLSGIISKFIPNVFNQKHMYVLRENELLIDTAAELIKRGIFTSPLKAQKLSSFEKKKHDFLILRESLEPILMNRYEKYIPQEGHRPCFEKFMSLVFFSIEEQDHFSQVWGNTLIKLNHKKIAVASNTPHRANQIALSLECQKRDIPFFGFQHGVTHEIFNDYHFQKPYYEANISDIVLTFNDEMTKIGNDTYTSRGRCLAVGISKRYARAASIKKNTETFPPIAYISCNLATGNLSPVYNHIGDYDKSVLEFNDLVELNNLPHKVLYKAYPCYNRRYADPDPVLLEAKKLLNITVYDELVDLRYLLGNFKVIIVTQASSTLSWIMFSEKPVVFIDNQSVCGLRPELYNDFSRAVFVFSRNEPDMLEKLVKFLSRPLEVIENEWSQADKKLARELFVKKYFSVRIEGAGAAAAQILCDEYFNKN